MCEQFKFLTRNQTNKLFSALQKEKMKNQRLLEQQFVLETRKLATELTQRENSIISKCLVLQKAGGKFHYMVPCHKAL